MRSSAARPSNEMPEILEPELADYVERLTSPHEPLLAELSEETARSLGSEGMLSGPVAGRFLELLVWFGRPQRVLEIGTFSGHSALAMAAGLQEGGGIDTCELDHERAARPNGSCRSSGWSATCVAPAFRCSWTRARIASSSPATTSASTSAFEPPPWKSVSEKPSHRRLSR